MQKKGFAQFPHVAAPRFWATRYGCWLVLNGSFHELIRTVRGRVGRSPHGSVLKGLQGKLSSHLHSCQVPAGEKKHHEAEAAVTAFV